MTADGAARDATLDPSRYTDPEFARAERKRLWPRTWLMACIAADVAKPGYVAELAIDDQSVLVVRGKDGVLRAFHNVCTHRGNRLREGNGRAGLLRCQYHNWCWHLDGSVSDIPRREAFPCLTDDEAALHPCAVEEWEGLVFVFLGEDPPPLRDYLQPVTDRFGPYHLPEYGCITKASVRVEANWKTLCDSFLEAYHAQGIHRQVLAYLDEQGVTFEVWDTHSHMVVPIGVPSPRAGDLTPTDVLRRMVDDEGFYGMVLRAMGIDRTVEVPAGQTAASWFAGLNRDYLAAHGVATDLTDSQLVDDHHYFLFPNLIVNHFGSTALVTRCRPDPTDHERSWWDVWVLSRIHETTPTPTAPIYDGVPTDELGRIANQDLDALPGVQLGMHDRSLTAVRLGTDERRIVAFHETIDRWLAAP